MHIYAFGSICRGDVSLDSDIDLLAVVDGFDLRFDPSVFSIYSYRRIEEIWNEGNPFAWHLALEARLLFSSDETDFLKALGRPSPYTHCVRDCEKFMRLFDDTMTSIMANSNSAVFDLSAAFLSIRNIATCFSLGATKFPDFSRHSALRLQGRSFPVSAEIYNILERARLLCTRGKGADISEEEVALAAGQFGIIHEWMSDLTKEVKTHERV